MSKYKTNGTDCAEKWEERVAFVLPPSERRISCFIEPSEAALATHETTLKDKRTKKDTASLIYTDGSGFEGHIGAAAVNIHDGDTVISDRRHLGTEGQSTVYAAELSGIEMALDRAIRDNKANMVNGTKRNTAREVIILSDSQAAIQAVQNPQRPSGQYVLNCIYEHVRTIQSQSTNITLRWIPAHVGVPGNEAADSSAKYVALEVAGGATGGGGTGADQPTIRLAAAAKRMVRERIQDRWKKQWESERTAQPTKRLVEWPSKKTLRLYE
ncbi:hypothetical protein PENARI_c147G02044 [Penicillium arizonense]|uniref:RNase H type-1 domain-containing protein n=1 Tax=Penicillium arizonense TaxID=1835702 RepID=A0A1F5L0Z6_PENAI|nr:hypothetical protein PENARI_c147G02044 [Penicillium arizonense]OGE46660.1 hypothetical protein PENARI_c147G02044 [Penicillium arizonense]